MRITWLGQAGLLFEVDGLSVLIDPYLSDSVSKYEPQNHRRVPVDERFLAIVPDVIVITHNHGDHLDKETLCHYLLKNSRVTVLAPNGAWQAVRDFGGVHNKYVLFNAGTTWTERGVAFRAVKAEHSDEHAIGCLLTVLGKTYYVTGDTLYSEKVFASLPDCKIDGLFLPVNGVGNNMNFADATRFAERVHAGYTVPLHIGLFDDLTADGWDCKNKRILPMYEKVKL